MHFQFERLGWKSFQDLTLAVAQHVYGLAVASFSLGADAGRDGAAVAPATGDSSWGKVVIQSKHTAVDAPLRLGDVTPEHPKIKRLVVEGRCDSYMFVTNKRVSALVEASVVDRVKKLGVPRVVVLGRETLERLLAENKELRGLIPRVYGLGDLSEILDERVYQQTSLLLDDDDLAKFVTTEAYFRTLDALADHQFALLLGEPASGKSSIMRAAAIHAADRWTLNPMWVSSLAELRERWNPHRSDQLFLVDDVFGSTSYDPEQGELWNRHLPLVKAAIGRGSRFMLTSRDYVFTAAKRYIKHSELPVAKEGEVVIEVEKLSLDERRQIVYNHLKLGRQPSQFKTAIKPHLGRLTRSPRFLPETARRLGDPRFTAKLDPRNPVSLGKFVDEPREYLLDVVRTLEPRLQNALVVLIVEGGSVPSPVELTPDAQAAAARLRTDALAIGRALAELDGSLVRRVESSTGAEFVARHPTVIDAVNDWLLTEPELLHLYIRHSPVGSLVRQVSCGLPVRGTVALPVDMWDVVLARVLDEDTPTDLAQRFFAYRVSTKAIRMGDLASTLVRRVSSSGFRSPLDGDPATRLFLRLQASHLLDEADVRTLAQRIATDSAGAFDPYPLRNPAVEYLVTGGGSAPEAWLDVIELFLTRCREGLQTHVATQMSTYSGDVARVDVFAGIVDMIDALTEWIDEASPVAVILRRERARIETWVEADAGPGRRAETLESIARAVFGDIGPTDIFSDLDT